METDSSDDGSNTAQVDTRHIALVVSLLISGDEGNECIPFRGVSAIANHSRR